jgi:PAS domain S-box-containing protein
MTDPAKTAFFVSPQAQVLLDPLRDRALTANDEACRFFARELPQLRGERFSRYFAEALPAWIVFTEEAMSEGSAWSDSLSFALGGRRVRVEASARLARADNSVSMLLSFQDAECLQRRRERAEAQRHYESGIGHWTRIAGVFQEFERQNRLILDSAGEGIYGIDAEGRTTFVNAAAERMLGWETRELIGKNIHHVIHHSHRDGNDYCAADCPIYQAFRDGVKRNVDNEVFWRKDGAAIDVEYTSTPIHDNGHLIGAVVIFRDVTQKRLDQQRLLAALSEVERLKHRLELENAYLQEEINSGFNHHRIIGNSPAIRHVIRKIEMVAPTDATALICGESGTGKELIARAIHELSRRRDRSLIRVNCAAIPEGLFESEFFGHGKGAFTGATGPRIGRFELADGGTLFLDEVGEIPLALQGKLLRVLQEQQFERVGESKTRNVDVRIIAATNRDLKELVRNKEFREDLYFRLNVFPIEAVPLRERREDVPSLAMHFLKRAATRANKPQLKIPLSQMEKLQQYSWPGNIRELENVIERQVILARGEHVLFPDLDLPAAATNGSTRQPGHDGRACDVYTETELRENEKTNILAALRKCRGKVFGKNGAAELLDIKPTTLSSRIKKYEIDVSRYKHNS